MISSHLWSSLAATRFHDTPSTLAFVGIKGIIVVISALGQNRKAYVERGALFIGWAASRVSGVPWAYRYPWWYQWLPDTVPASAMWGSSAARFFRSHSWRGQLRHAYPTLPSLLRFWGNLPPGTPEKGKHSGVGFAPLHWPLGHPVFFMTGPRITEVSLSGSTWSCIFNFQGPSAPVSVPSWARSVSVTWLYRTFAEKFMDL